MDHFCVIKMIKGKLDLTFCFFSSQMLYSNSLGEERTFVYGTSLYLTASASAEFFADIELSMMEAVKVHIQTMPGNAKTLREGAPKLWAVEGIRG